MGVENVPEVKAKRKGSDKEEGKGERVDKRDSKQDISIKGAVKALKERQRLLDEV